MEHPYVPRDLQLPGFVPEILSHFTILAIYGISSLLVVSLVFILSGRWSKVSKVDRWLMCWWAFTGLTHMVVEGYFVFSPEFYKDKTGFYLAEVWKEYSKGDSRYAARDSTVIAIEGITAVLEGPPCLLAVSLWIDDRQLQLFDLRCEGLVNRTIGEVRVPMKDLIDEFNGAVRFVSYQVRNCNGKANGVLNFSYKLIGNTKKLVKNHTKVQFPAEKVHYPKLEDDDEYSGDIKYPSLDDIGPPAPQQFNFPSPVPVLECQRQGFYRASLAEVPPYWVAHGAYSPSILQSHGPYYSGLHRHEGFGKSGVRTNGFPPCS